jgi:protein-tyrosine phosphatase
MSLREADLERAELRIALDRTEHHPMVLERFPHWLARIEFWDVADADITHPEDALPAIERQVRALVAQLRRA